MKMARWMAVLFSVMVLSLSLGCGGGGGGGGFFLPPSSLAKGTFVKTPNNTTNTYTGLLDTNPYTRWQNLYTANTISASGKITGFSIKYEVDMTSAVTCTGITVKLGHTNLTDLTGTFVNNVATGQGSQVTVLSNGMATFPTGSAGTWHAITFTTPFDYNGVDNLVIDFERAAACSGRVRDADQDPTTSTLTAWTFTPASPTGSTGTWVQNGRLTFQGGDDLAKASDGTGNNANFFAPGAAGRTQMLILAADIAGSGPITGMAIRPSGTTVQNKLDGVTIVLSQVTITSLDTNFATNRAGGTSTTTVASNMTYTIPANLSVPVWIPFKNSSFNYDGTSNILVDVIVSSSTDTYAVAYQNTPTVRIINSSDPAAATGGAWSRSFEPIFRFNGGKVVVIPASSGSAGSSQVLGSGTAGQIQSLYPQSLIGTGGSIQNIYVRLRSTATPTAASLTNYKVYMGHTDKNTLNMAEAYSSNMTENATVFSGTLTIPAGLKAGDWVKIPLSSSFTYNPEKNLCILFAADAGPAGNGVSVRSDASQFPSFSVGRNDNAVTSTGMPAWNYDGIVDLAVDISK